jgi:hypothetical protein
MLRYQLLTATAGALRAGKARGTGRVVLLVQEFVTRLTNDKKHQVNTNDLNLFVTRLSHGAVLSIEPAVLYGPIDPLTPLLAVAPPLYIAKTTCILRQTVG